MRRNVCLTLTVLLVAATAARGAERPNFVLCMADDQGYGDVAYNGHPVLRTPVLDEMAASGLRFDRFYAAHPVCSPTRGSVMTGRHPNRFACFSWGHTLRPEEVTVAEALKQAGYATGHFGKWHIGSVRDGDPVSPGGSGFDEWVSAPNFYENSPLLSHNGRVIETDGESSEVTVRAALEFIRRQASAGTPFLAVVWFGNPHTPHEGVEELKALYPQASEAERNYYAEITGIDRAMGLLRRELRELDIAGETLLWYTSDNGQQARSPGSSGGLRGAKGSLWEGGIRVPGIIEWPDRIPRPRVTGVPAGTVDIYPTLLELAGATVGDQPPLDGVSLVPLLDGERDSRDEPMGFWVYQSRGIRTPSAELMEELRREQRGEIPAGSHPEQTPASRMSERFRQSHLPGHAAWIEGDFKLHRIPVRNSGEFTYALYDLSSDPAEQRDLAADAPDRLRRMKDALRGWQVSVIASLNGEDY